MTIKLSEDEYISVNKLLAKYSERANYTLTLELLLEKWHVFVSQVEMGYSESVYEYQNDLSTRTIFKEIMDELADSVKIKLSDELQPLDERFMNATNSSTKPWCSGISVEEYPWLFRVPKILAEEFKQDLMLEGYLPK